MSDVEMAAYSVYNDGEPMIWLEITGGPLGANCDLTIKQTKKLRAVLKDALARHKANS